MTSHRYGVERCPIKMDIIVNVGTIAKGDRYKPLTVVQHWVKYDLNNQHLGGNVT